MIARFRFAPSPTGIPHIGNLHTALFSWALARAMGGDFILRIDDTDSERNTATAVPLMLDALTWLGLDWDEGPDGGGDYGPYYQSQRLHFYRETATQLIAGGHAYYGDDPEQPAPAGANQPLRLRFPVDGHTVINDALRGPVSFDNAVFKDPILMRSDGTPLYHLATVVDDHLMAISHVVRGDEWLASAPIHARLYQAMDWTEPVWVHKPLILNKRGEKLKKRDPEGGYLITDFQNAGYLPEALFNYLLLLGWAPDGEQEIVNKWDVRRQFRLERLSKSPATFDWDKLKWVNRQYLQRRSDNDLADLIRPYLEDDYGTINNAAWLVRLTGVIRDELSTLADAPTAAAWAFDDQIEYTPEGLAALHSEAAGPAIRQLLAALLPVVLLDTALAQGTLQHVRDELKARHGLAAPAVFHPIRAALTGSPDGPPLAEILDILGKERTLQRLAAALRLRQQ
jgi:glutamyl-tRNA synthetase